MFLMFNMFNYVKDDLSILKQIRISTGYQALLDIKRYWISSATGYQALLDIMLYVLNISRSKRKGRE